ncbi:hypothetical protein AAV32_12005 [Kerstersia gyiorum]|uniref:Uncharacterized protein n=1 Tax=Kerstersia gyiorum TaxID=206506 RepID=A0A171KQV3_9BURK|nr:hypothetical protein AAV32_12005 [Kerstersia gyiorum]
MQAWLEIDVQRILPAAIRISSAPGRHDGQQLAASRAIRLSRGQETLARHIKLIFGFPFIFRLGYPVRAHGALIQPAPGNSRSRWHRNRQKLVALQSRP